MSCCLETRNQIPGGRVVGNSRLILIMAIPFILHGVKDVLLMTLV